MKFKQLYIYLNVFVVSFALSSFSFGMPPAPELLERIQNREIELPFFLANETELRLRGVEQPNEVNWRRHTDETDTTFFSSILLIVDFSDQPAQTAATFFDTLMFGNTVGKVRHFYREISREQLFLVTNHPPSLVGWIRLPQTYSYYVNGQNGFGDYPQNAQRMVEDAIQLANAAVDFSQYDIDGNGSVDGLMVVHSGQGAELTGNSNHIWSHAWNLNTPVQVDGVTINNYNTVPEYWLNPNDMTCGVFAHEMGHSFFGLPDLYDTDYSSEGLGKWSLMAGGSWNGQRGNSPAHPDAYCRITMGFASSTNVLGTLSNQSIPAVQTSGTIYRMWRNGTLGNQYFLVENRRRIGYDASLPGDGLLIYHVDRSVNSNRNEWYPGRPLSSHYRVALEQADGRWDLEHNNNSGDLGDPFPGSSTNRNFTTSTTPNSRSYTNTSTQVGVIGISNSSSTMTADLLVNGGSIVIESPNGGDLYAVGGTYTIEWAASSITGSKTIELNRNYPNGTWELLSSNVTADSSIQWTVSGDTTSRARVRVRTNSMTPEIAGISDEDFSIGYGTVALTRPNGGETFTEGNRHAILWDYTGISGFVRIEINRNYPSGTWDIVAEDIPFTSPYSWTCTGPATTNARLRIRTLDMAVVIADTSDAEFTIRATSVHESDGSQPSEFELISVYPNPFNSQTRIRISELIQSPFHIELYNVEGKLLRTISGKNGQREIEIQAADFANGTYYLLLYVHNQVIARNSFTLIK